MTPMKTLIASGAALAAAGRPAAALQTMNLQSIKARGGSLQVGVQAETQFLQNGAIAGEIVPEPVAGKTSFRYGLAESARQVALWNDFNASGQCDLTEASPPSDGWAMITGETMHAIPALACASLALPAGGAATTLKVICAG